MGQQGYPNCTEYREFFDAVVSATDLQESYWRAWRLNAPELSGAMCSYNVRIRLGSYGLASLRRLCKVLGSRRCFSGC